MVNATPVYLVTFKGVNGRGHSAQAHITPTFTELNAVVDANIGELPMSFYTGKSNFSHNKNPHF